MTPIWELVNILMLTGEEKTPTFHSVIILIRVKVERKFAWKQIIYYKSMLMA